jgi:hypothetical protein
MFTASVVNAQYTKEKLRDLLCGSGQKTWIATGINTDRPEKTMTFKTPGGVVIEDQGGKTKTGNWTLQSADNIRWFIDIAGTKYELIVSYNKKGEQYIKLTHHENNDYEIKLTQTK